MELRAAAVKAWEHIARGMLLGKVIWNVRTKKLLGVIDAPPGDGSLGDLDHAAFVKPDE